MHRQVNPRISASLPTIPTWCCKYPRTDALYQVYFGEKLRHEADLDNLGWQVHPASDGSTVARGWEVYSGSGNEDFFEPALAVTHTDGNPSTYLYYVSHRSKPVDGGTQTDIVLRDDRYPLEVTLHYVAYAEEDVIKTWSDISHKEKGSVFPLRLRLHHALLQRRQLLPDGIQQRLGQRSPDEHANPCAPARKCSTPSWAAVPPCTCTPSSCWA